MKENQYNGKKLHHRIFEKILSIGYKFGTLGLYKHHYLQRINLLLNTDTVSNDLQYINKDATPIMTTHLVYFKTAN